LIKHGLAKLIDHRRDANERAFNYAKLSQLQDAARESGKGMWSSKTYNPPQIDDFSDRRRGGNDGELQRIRRAAINYLKEYGIEPQMNRRRIGRRNQQEEEEEQTRASPLLKGIVEYCVQATKLKITLVEEKPMKKIFLFLSGIKGFDKDKDKKDFSDRANKIVKQLVQQKEVWVSLENVDNWSNFLGQVWTAGKNWSSEKDDRENLAEKLLLRGMAEIFPPSADRSVYKELLETAQKAAKDNRKGVWENWEPAPVEPEKTEDEVPLSAPQSESVPKAEPQQKRSTSHPYSGKTLTGLVTHIENGSTFFVNLGDDKKQDLLMKVTEHMGSVSPLNENTDLENWSIDTKTLSKERPVVSALYSDENYYRFRVMSYRKKDDKYKGLFVDFGNTDWVPEANLLPLDPAIAAIEELAYKCNLACLKPPLPGPYFDPAGELLQNITYGQTLELKIVNVMSEHRGDYEIYNAQSKFAIFEVAVSYDDCNVNEKVVSLGYGRIDKKKRRFYTEEENKPNAYLQSILDAEQTAMQNNMGMYEFGRGGMESDDEDNKPRGRGRRR
jgi:staphylococcal nuclease domain-containing protein 1